MDKLPLKDKRVEAEQIDTCIRYVEESTKRLRELSITMRQSEDNMQANMAYELWLREMQRFEYLCSQLKQIAMGGYIPPYY